MKRFALVAAAVISLSWASERVRGRPQTAAGQLLLGAERDLPLATTALVQVSGGLNGDGYHGLDTLSLVLTNLTDWEITEITIEITAVTRDEPSTKAYALRTMSAVRARGVATLTARLDEAVPDLNSIQWRYLSARGLPPN